MQELIFNLNTQKSKKLVKLGNYIFGNTVRILLIDCERLTFLKRYKHIKDIIQVSKYEKRIYFLIAEILNFRATIIKSRMSRRKRINRLWEKRLLKENDYKIYVKNKSSKVKRAKKKKTRKFF